MMGFSHPNLPPVPSVPAPPDISTVAPDAATAGAEAAKAEQLRRGRKSLILAGGYDSTAPTEPRTLLGSYGGQ